MTGPVGYALDGYHQDGTRLLCPCGQWTSIYQTADGLLVPGAIIAAADVDPVQVTCHCGRPGIVDPVKLRHAIAERRPKFRIQ
jgi:hypothetical protein